MFPKTTSSHQIQRNYRKIFNQVKEDKSFIVVLTNNQPDVVISDFETFEKLEEIKRKYEISEMEKALNVYRIEKKAGKLKKLNSLADLMDEV